MEAGGDGAAADLVGGDVEHAQRAARRLERVEQRVPPRDAQPVVDEAQLARACKRDSVCAHWRQRAVFSCLLALASATIDMVWKFVACTS